VGRRKVLAKPGASEAVLRRWISDIRFNRQALDDWYCLLHKLQNGKVLQEIQKGKVKYLDESSSSSFSDLPSTFIQNPALKSDAVDFLKDGLFCEWAYFIDFENQKLETWKAGEMIAVATFEGLASKGDLYMDNLERPEEENEEE
jgi:hypothetical protein